MLIFMYIIIEIITIIISLKYLYWYVAVFFTFIVIAYLKIKYNNKIYILLCLFVCVITCLSYNYNSNSELRQYENSNKIIQCKILNKDRLIEGKDYFRVCVKIKSIDDKNLNDRAMLFVKNQYFKELLPGDSIELKVEFKNFDNHKNFKISNYEEYLKQIKVRALLFAKGDIKYLNRPKFSMYAIKYKIKRRVEENFMINMNKDSSGIILSILLGDKSYLDDITKSASLITGIAHIFAVSGLHVGIIIKIIYSSLNKILYHRKLKIVLTIIFAWLYGFIVAFPISICRALIMFSLLYLSKLTHRKYAAVSSLVISAIILLIYNPFSLFNAGFLLSYIVTFAIVTAKKEHTNSIKKKMKNSIDIYIRILILSFPLLVYFFNYVSFVGIFMNLLIIPMFVIIIKIGFILALLSIFSMSAVVVPMRILNYSIYFLKNLIVSISELKILDTSICGSCIMSFSLAQILSYYIVIYFLTYIKNTHSKYYSLYCTCSLFLIIAINTVCLPYVYEYNSYKVFDIGQGIFSNLSINNRSNFFDVGSTEKDIYNYTVNQIIMKNGYYNIDNIYISHFHSDHYSSVASIINDFQVQTINISHNFPNSVTHAIDDEKGNISNLTEMKNAIFKNNIKCKILRNNYMEELSEHTILHILSPVNNYSSSNENNYSNVYWVNIEGVNFLLTGDIESDIEKELISEISKYKRVYGDIDVLMVPHHGSKTSSTRNFVETCKPRVAVFSYGENSYGIPSYDVLNRYRDCGSIILKTKEDGQINFFVINGNLYYNTYSGKHSRNWKYLIYYSIIINGISIFVIYKFRRKYEF